MDKFAKEDEIILQKYVIDDVINGDEGARGEVYRCRSKGKWRVFALKKTRYLKPSNEGIPSTTLEEINERKKLDHPNVIRIIDMKESVDEPIQYLVYEHMEFDLSKYMEFHSRVLENANIMPKEIKMLMYQLLSGLNYCHNRGVFHRNLKPSNLLINQRTSVLKIGDFGLGRGYDDPSKDYHLNVVTPWYRAPELFLGALEYSSSTDIWAVGCILAELYRKRPLFKSSIDVQIHAIFKLIGTPNENVWPGVTKLKYWHEFPKWPKPFNWAGEVPNMDEQGLDLLSKMLQSDPRERITANAAMYHSYFSDIRKHGYLN